MLFPCLTLLLLLPYAPSVSAAPALPSIGHATRESYQEDLRITPLVDGKVLSEFNFIMRGPGDAEQESQGESMGLNSIGTIVGLLPQPRDRND